MAQYTLVSFYDEELPAWTLPQGVRGVEKTDIEAYKEDLIRSCRKGNVSPSNIGLMVFVIGQFDDNTGKVEMLDQPVFLLQLFKKEEVKEL